MQNGIKIQPQMRETNSFKDTVLQQEPSGDLFNIDAIRKLHVNCELQCDWRLCDLAQI